MAFIGNTYTTQGFIPAIDYFNGNGSTTAFTLSRPVASVAQVQAVIENVPQNPGSAYTVSGNTITFTSAPPSGTSNIYVYYTSPITQVIAPGQGTVTTTSLGNITNIASGNSSLTLQTGTTPTTAMTIDTSQNVGIGTASPSYRLDVISTGGTQTARFRSGDTATTVDIASFERSDSAVKAVINYNSSDGAMTYGTSTNHPIAFKTNNTERARIDTSGNFRVGDANYNFTAGASGQSRVTVNNDYCFQFTRKNGTGVYVYFTYNTTDTGTISTNGTTTSYNTSSDYRLKENIAPMTGALATVAQLKPVTYTWKSNGEASEGFIAHELQAVVPQCVVGEKDAVDADGNPIYQGIDTSFLVATLTAAIQEQQALITQLTERISALEGK